MNNPILNPKPLPKKLEDDLNNVNRCYKGGNANSQGRISTSQDDEKASLAPTSRRPSALSAMFDDSAEKAMYDEILGPLLKPRGRLPAGSGYEATRTASKSSSVSSTHSSSDFTTTLLQRLKVVEAEAKESRQSLAAQLARNEELEQAVSGLREAAQDVTKTADELRESQAENRRLKQRIREMEDFLADYGLQWVGNNNTHSNTHNTHNTHSDEKEQQESESAHIVSYADFARHIKELNEIIYSEPTQIVKTERTARLAHASEVLPHVRIAFHRNGLMIKRGPFRPCDSDSYHSFVQDVMDGYFPSEFRKEYPDGVIFDLVDRHDEDYEEGVSDSVEPLSSAQFLNRLPKTVVKNGEIVQVRGDIERRLLLRSDVSHRVEHALPRPSAEEDTENMRPKTAAERVKESFAHREPDPFQANYGKVIVLQTPASQLSTTDNNPSLGCVAKIQIKWIDRTTLIATMYELNTVKELRREICKHFHLHDINDVELRTAFPSKLLFDGMTLMEAELVPNGTIHARKI